MNNNSILAFSLITLNYLFLIWCTATFSGMNIVYFAIMVVFMLLADILIKDYKRMPIDFLFCLIVFQDLVKDDRPSKNDCKCQVYPQ